MERKNTIINVPGKLMIAGEYAILGPEADAIVLAVNRYMRVKIIPSKEYSIFSLMKHEENHWIYDKKNRIQFKQTEEISPFVISSLEIAFEYLEFKEIPLDPFHIEVTSQLDDKETGKKYGLGSSAALAVGIITAILDYFQILEETSLEARFILCAAAHLKAQGSGSCADIAACVYSGWVWFKSFDTAWLLENVNKKSGIKEILAGLLGKINITSLTSPDDLYIYFGWTMESAKTPNMVGQVFKYKEQNPKKYERFLALSKNATTMMIQGFLEQNTDKIIEAVGMNREALLYLDKMSGMVIETKELSRLCNIGELYGKGKPSGAGGGDCGIVMTNQNVIDKLWKAWEKEGIQPLDLTSGRMYKE